MSEIKSAETTWIDFGSTAWRPCQAGRSPGRWESMRRQSTRALLILTTLGYSRSLCTFFFILNYFNSNIRTSIRWKSGPPMLTYDPLFGAIMASHSLLSEFWVVKWSRHSKSDQRFTQVDRKQSKALAQLVHLWGWGRRVRTRFPRRPTLPRKPGPTAPTRTTGTAAGPAAPTRSNRGSWAEVQLLPPCHRMNTTTPRRVLLRWHAQLSSA